MANQDDSLWAGLLGLQRAKFDKLYALDYPDETDYINVAVALWSLQGIGPNINSHEERISALEAKVQALDEQKATKLVALDHLSLDEVIFPNQLSQQAGPTPQSASAINLNGENAYIQFDGRTHVLDYTKDWSIGCNIQTQGEGTEATNMTAFSSGGVSLNLEVQGAPHGEGSNWGLYTTSNGDLYHVAARANANTWASPADDCRLLWVYTASEKKLAYYISYADGSYSRKANISIPQTYIDEQTPPSQLEFFKSIVRNGRISF